MVKRILFLLLGIILIPVTFFMLWFGVADLLTVNPRGLVFMVLTVASLLGMVYSFYRGILG